jgi:hypothetical protein
VIELFIFSLKQTLNMFNYDLLKFLSLLRSSLYLSLAVFCVKPVYGRTSDVKIWVLQKMADKILSLRRKFQKPIIHLKAPSLQHDWISRVENLLVVKV